MPKDGGQPNLPLGRINPFDAEDADIALLEIGDELANGSSDAAAARVLLQPSKKPAPCSIAVRRAVTKVELAARARRSTADPTFRLANTNLRVAASPGRIAFNRVSGSIYFDLKSPDLQQVLEKIASSHDIAVTLDSFNPQQPQYKELKATLARARKVPGVDETKLQRAHKGGGNQSAKEDVILANMERWRWIPRDLGAAYVMVNIPDYTLTVMNNGKSVWSTRVVVGQPGKHATPLLAETIKYITFNPTWNVPPSIIRNEYLPALARDPTVLARMGLRIGRNSDGSIRIYQPPSERNALGRVRFNFPNQFLVYQHDTPDKYLFGKPLRAYSHGCMRVEYPDKYAETLLSISQPDYRSAHSLAVWQRRAGCQFEESHPRLPHLPNSIF